MITKENLAFHELIGTRATIVGSGNMGIIGVSGMVVDETKFMLALDTKNGIKKFPKEVAHWRFSFEGGEAEIDGTKLTKRPHERMGVKA